jgi:L-glyceraldehyde 3-phosphate reductase
MIILDPAYRPEPSRYDSMPYNRCGHSGLLLPAISLGLWRNFGNTQPFDVQRAVYRRAFDLGITHFDFANNYGIPFGAAERNFGRVMSEDLSRYRDELVISTKAGWDMWPGPYGNWGSRKYLLASLDQSLLRMGLDYVDIYYHHRPDPNTPIEETMGALDSVVRQGKALYVGISSYTAVDTRRAIASLRELGTPLLVHQPSYSMLNRWIEEDLLDLLADEGVGCIGFSVLAQGMLTGKYSDSVPPDSRAAERRSLFPEWLSEENLSKIRSLGRIAQERGQTLAQMAIAWALRHPPIASVLIGVKNVDQLEDNLRALGNLEFSSDELEQIDRFATESGINLWAAPSDE